MEQHSSAWTSGISLLVLVVNVFLLLVIMAPEGHYNPASIQKKLDTGVLTTPKVSTSSDLLLEWKLVDQYIEDEWLVEKYQEYEIHMNEDGKVEKETPTNQYNYLKYWIYK